MDVHELDFNFYAEMLANSVKNDVYNNIPDEFIQEELISYVNDALQKTLDVFEVGLETNSLAKKEQ